MRRLRLHHCLLLLVCANWLSAQNLVPNPSFEAMYSEGCGVYITGEFAQHVQNWYAPTDATPDHFSTTNPVNCWNHVPNSTYAGPICTKGPQLPRTGDGMAGMFLYTIPNFEQREYIQVQLSSRLVPCQQYEVEFYVSLADYTEKACDHVGIHLSTAPILMSLYSVIHVVPQVQSPGMVTDTMNWVRVADTITADLPYEYLTFGNFYSDGMTQTVFNPTAISGPGCYGAYYYLDDVSIRPVCQEVTLSGSVSLCLGDSVELIANAPSCYDSLRWNTGAIGSTIHVMDGGEYMVTMYSGSCVSSDSIHVEAKDCPPLLELGNAFSPNGDGINDYYVPVTAQSLLWAEVMIYDRWGRQVWISRDMAQGWDGRVGGRDSPEGVYYCVSRFQGKDLKLGKSVGTILLVR